MEKVFGIRILFTGSRIEHSIGKKFHIESEFLQPLVRNIDTLTLVVYPGQRNLNWIHIST